MAAEPGREIVKAQTASGGDGLPCANTQRFIGLCAEPAVAAVDRQVRLPQRTLLDRSFVVMAPAVELSVEAQREAAAA